MKKAGLSALVIVLTFSSLCYTASSEDVKFESFCSLLNSTTLFKINTSKIYQGSLRSHKFNELPLDTITEGLPIACKCLLQIESDDGEGVTLFFNKFDIAESEPPEDNDEADVNELDVICSSDFVKIYEVDRDGDESTAKLKAGYCGSGNVENVLGKPGKSLIVEAKLTQPFRGFEVDFLFGPQTRLEINPCKRTGYVPCPNMKQFRCIPESFLCDGKSDCLNGGDEEKCLRTDPVGDPVGSLEDSGCGTPRRVNGIAGSIYSMGYEGGVNYSDNARCIWYITSPPGTKIWVSFSQQFSIQSSDFLSDDCSYDSLAFYSRDEDGHLSVVSRYCGSRPPNAIALPNNVLIAVFESDSHTNQRGFKFVWQALNATTDLAVTEEWSEEISEEEEVEEETTTTTTTNTDLVMEIDEPDRGPGVKAVSPPPKFHGASPAHAACSSPSGLKLTSWSTMISTPSPLPKGGNVVCKWVIAPKMKPGLAQKAIDFRFYDFTPDPSQNCSKDLLEISFVDKSGGMHRGRYSCGRTPPFEEALTAQTDKPVTLIYRPWKESRFEVAFIVITTRQKVLPSFSPIVLVKNCGLSSVAPKLRARVFGDGMERIIGGQVVIPGSWPWTVELVFREQHFCGATVINENWLLTAAHCFKERIYRNLADWHVVVGRHSVYDRTAWDKQSPVLYPRLKNIYTHKEYDERRSWKNASLEKAFDIALVKLAQPLTLGDLASAACLPSRELRSTDKCYVVGWGNPYDKSSEGVLKQAEVPIIDNRKCQAMNFLYEVTVKDNMICAGYEAGGTDACKGDSGGPLICKIGNKWEVHGIVSFGKGCAGANAPGVYTRVTSYLSFLKSVIDYYSPHNN